MNWKLSVRHLKQSLYFYFPVYETQLTANNLIFSKEFGEDMRICKCLQSKTIRNHYFRYVIQKYGFFFFPETEILLGGYLQLDISLDFDTKISLREALQKFQILYKKYFKQFLLAYKANKEGKVKGEIVEGLMQDLDVKEEGFRFQKKFTAVNQQEPNERHIGKILKRFRNLTEDLMLVKINTPFSTSNKAQFVLNFRPPNTKKQIKAALEIEKNQKLECTNYLRC